MMLKIPYTPGKKGERVVQAGREVKGRGAWVGVGRRDQQGRWSREGRIVRWVERLRRVTGRADPRRRGLRARVCSRRRAGTEAR